MSAGTHTDHAAHDGHDAHTEGGASHSTFSGYMIGFALSVVLTAIPFWLVMAHVLPTASMTALVVMGFAAVQVLVHMIYFLHLNTKSEAGWTMLALIFTLVVVAIALSGSLWVMFHLNANMMPMSMPELRNTP